MSGIGSFFKGLGGSLTNMMGITGTRDNGAAQAAVNHAVQGNQQLYGDWQNQNNANRTFSNQLANQNYMAGAQQAYGQQQQAAGLLYNQATGQAPSAAQLQQQQGLAQANQQTQSAAYGMQNGVAPGATQRNVLNAQANQDANIVASGMSTRAAEQAQEQNNYANLLGAMQGEQQNMGQFQYGQGQNNLNFQDQSSQNAFSLGNQLNNNNANLLTGNYNQAGQANAAQAGALKSTAEDAIMMFA